MSSCFRSVEHQIADIKQRLAYYEKLSIEHQNEYMNLDQNLQLFKLNIDKFKDSFQTQLLQITIEDIRIIDVSLRLKTDKKKYTKTKELNLNSIFWKIANSLNARVPMMINNEVKFAH